MKFNFRFKSLLAYRAHRQERAEAALGKARQQLNRARVKEKELTNRLEEAGEELRALLRKEAPASILKSYADFLSELERNIDAQERVIARIERDVRDCLQEVLLRTKETRIIERLREKDEAAWLYSQMRQEQKTMDETAVTRHGRTVL